MTRNRLCCFVSYLLQQHQTVQERITTCKSQSSFARLLQPPTSQSFGHAWMFRFAQTGAPKKAFEPLDSRDVSLPFNPEHPAPQRLGTTRFSGRIRCMPNGAPRNVFLPFHCAQTATQMRPVTRDSFVASRLVHPGVLTRFFETGAVKSPVQRNFPDSFWCAERVQGHKLLLET